MSSDGQQAFLSGLPRLRVPPHPRGRNSRQDHLRGLRERPVTATGQLQTLCFAVVGMPAPQGSKRHVGNGVMVESSRKVKPWRQDVVAAALAAMGLGWTQPTGPVRVTVTFYLPRPKGHHGTGRNAGIVKASAPPYPFTKPDADKLLRSTLDALTTAGVVRDDAQVVELVGRKRYVIPNSFVRHERQPGAFIEVEQL